MNKSTLVSVVMITYNHGKYIKQAIEGILMQKTNFNVELIIANDCSTDNTHKEINDIIKKYNGLINIRYYNHTQNKGMMENFIWTLNKAKGNYIALCEGDDYWTDPYKLQKQVDFLEENEDYSLCSHNRIRVDANNKILIRDEFKYINTKVPYTQCVLFRNVFPDKTFFEYAEKITNADGFLFNYLEMYGKVGFMDFIGSAYRVHENGVWSMLNKKKQYEESKKSLEVMIDYFNLTNNKRIVKKVMRQRAHAEIYYGREIAKINKLSALNYLIRFNLTCLKYKFFSLLTIKVNISFLKYLILNK
jgi:glycosyltransferase involved in cell wall biosynthesis